MASKSLVVNPTDSSVAFFSAIFFIKRYVNISFSNSGLKKSNTSFLISPKSIPFNALSFLYGLQEAWTIPT